MNNALATQERHCHKCEFFLILRPYRYLYDSANKTLLIYSLKGMSHEILILLKGHLTINKRRFSTSTVLQF